MRLRDFSAHQLIALSWWCPASPYSGYEAIICDGAVRSGKTLCMSLGFFVWAMETFDGCNFALCGKTVKGVRRNLVETALEMLRREGYVCREKLSQGLIEVSRGGKMNRFYTFGGRDESSAALIQGVTLAGVLFDEVALQPQSFVEQALARCSVEGARFWFNCNPQDPGHWFYREWICCPEQRRALYLSFRLEDNPSLSEATLERYRRMFSGVFHRRFILGDWVAASGLVYDFFSDEMLCEAPPESGVERWCISCDYGTANPASFGLWGLAGGVWYRVAEYYYASRRAGRQKTDSEYVEDIGRLAGGRPIELVVVDPSAASFILALSRAGYRVVKARNEVLSGIRITAEALKSGRIRICLNCRDSVREFGLYRWREGGGDEVIKEHDHAMDDIRYFAATIAAAPKLTAAAAVTAERKNF